eukprot:scaffold5538_cov159-Amphora_coffeaeformis.AAC.8
MASSEEANGEAEAPPQQIFSLNIFQTLDQAQSFHGIPSQDYDQYHQYCTKRLKRIRHHKEVRTLLTHNSKFSSEATSSGGGGKRRNAYCPRSIPARITHDYVLQNLLLEAERAWAVACAAQAAQKHDAAQRRFNKAVKWAQKLLDTLERCADETTLQEAKAYLAWMKGNKGLESKDYAAAFRQYTASRTILLELAAKLQSNNDDVDKLALSDLWTTRAETVLKPLIRFCQYEAKDKLDPSEVKGWDAQSNNKANNESKKSANDSMLLDFRNQAVDLETYPQLAVLYLKMEEVLENESSQKDEKVFLQLLADLDDALGIVASENSRYASLPAGPAVTAKRSELATLKSFFTFHKLQIQRKHQEDSLADTAEESVTDLFHFYDALQQNAQAVADLVVDTKANDEYNPEDDPHWLEAQAHVVRIRAFRCYYLACLYETVLNGTTAQVLALLHQSRVLQRRAAEEVAACELDDYLPGLQDLKTKIGTMQCRTEANRCLEVAGASTGIKTTNRPLWQRIDDLDAGSVLADDPPSTIPLPCKPTFFDLAGTFVADSVSTDALDEYIRENEPKKESSGGLFGWFG